ncbi:MAG: hypothetical protein ACOYO1_00550 [Bacteroidales bacterium]
MKKLNYLIGLALIVGFFSSCKKDETTLPAPTITFLNGVSTATIASGASYTIAGTIASEEGLTEVKYFKVTTAGETQIGQAITSFTDKNSFSFQQTINDITAQSVIKVQATDAKSQTTSANFTINIAGNAITSFPDITLGSYNSPTGSSFASLDGTVYQLADAKTNASKVDIIFFYGATNNATLSAPSNLTELNQVFTTASAPNTWAVNNDTKLEKRTDVVFDNVTLGNQIPNVQATGTSKVNNLAVGDVVAFRTANTNSAFANKVGILKVTAITGTGATATIKFSVKVAS